MDYHHRSRDECDAEKADHIVGDIETHTPERKPLIPRRAIVAVMVFLGAVFFYMVRSNFSLNLLAMVEKTDANGTVLAGQPDYGPRIRWTVYEQSMLLGAFFYGYGSAAVPIGLLVEKYGIAKAYICVALLVCTVLEVLSPWAAQTSFRCMFIVRLVMGLMQSAYYPATHKLYSKWAPMNEMGVFCFANLGSSFGTLITWTFTGYLIESAGWLSSFYFPGAILAAFTLAWYLLVFETPDVHPSITCREKEYIAENRPNMAKTNVREKHSHFSKSNTFSNNCCRFCRPIVVADVATIVEYSDIAARLGIVAAAVRQRLGVLFRSDWRAKVPQRGTRLSDRKHRNVGLSAVSLAMADVWFVWCSIRCLCVP